MIEGDAVGFRIVASSRSVSGVHVKLEAHVAPTLISTGEPATIVVSFDMI